MTRSREPGRSAWIALAAVEGIGPAAFGRLIARWGAPDEVLRRVRRDGADGVAEVLGMRADAPRMRSTLAALASAAAEPDRVERALDAWRGWALVPGDADWPSALRLLADPPLVLYGIGRRASVGEAAAVAIVGTRRASAAGTDAARRLAVATIEAGACVVSGLAVGIDAVAHATALRYGGRTVAVVGGGLGRAWPAPNARLAREIAHERGAIVGELPPGAAPTIGTFPRRNRLIAALADGVVVAEAPARSGALLTARHAFEQGRPVHVVPGPPDAAGFAGCRLLLDEAPAVACTHAAETVAAIVGEARRPVPPGNAEATSPPGPAERAVADALIAGPGSLDALARRSGLAVPVVAATLMLLQLRGWCVPLGSAWLADGPLLRLPGVPGAPGWAAGANADAGRR